MKAEIRSLKRVTDLRRMKEVIEKADKAALTQSERKILVKVVSFWVAHRFDPKPEDRVVRPGRKRLAKLCRVSVDTVAVAMAKFRRLGIITPVKYAKGGRGAGTKGCATHYTVDLAIINVLWGGDLPTVMPGELVPRDGNPTVGCVGKSYTDKGSRKNPTVECVGISYTERVLPYSEVPASTSEGPIQDEDGSNVVPFLRRAHHG